MVRTPVRRPLVRLTITVVAGAALTVSGGGSVSARPVPVTASSAGAVGVPLGSTSPGSAVPAKTLPTGYSCRSIVSTSVTYACVIGLSVDGRAIVAERQGNPKATRVLVLIGQMHGEEWPGPKAVDVVRATPVAPNAGFVIWTVRTMNPDGGAIGRRRNSHGVDLNGNFANKFTRTPDSGPYAFSEPESRAMARFLTWVQPDLVISLHGFSEAVDTTGGGNRAALARRFSALSGITPAHAVPCGRPCTGNMTDWYTATSTVRGVAFTVEMPRSSLVRQRCGVAGRPARATPIQCTAWAAVRLVSQLPG